MPLGKGVGLESPRQESSFIESSANGEGGWMEKRRKLAIEVLDLSIMKKTAADSKAKGKKAGSIRRLLGAVVICE